MTGMVVLEIVVVAVVVFAIAAFITGRIGGMSAAPPDAADNGLPPDGLASSDIDRVRFGLAFRGYEMAEVDAVLDRIRDRLAQAEAELAELRAQVTAARADDDRAEGDARADGAADRFVDSTDAPAEQWVTEPWRHA